MAADARLARLLNLVTLLRARSARRATDLAADLGVSERTVYRDLTALEVAGVPCQFDREAGGYRIDHDFFLPPVHLTLSEALALSVLADEFGRGRQVPFLADAWRAAAKVRSQLPPAVRDGVADADGHVRVQAARVSPQDGCDGHFETIRRAIADRRKVRCTYAGGKDHGGGGDPGRGTPGEPFLFRPYCLYFGQRAWYAIGHSERADAERTLKLNRFGSVERTDVPYMIPDGWTVEKALGKAWRMIPGDRRHVVRIRFDADAGRNVADTLWHPTQTVQWEDGPAGGRTLLFGCEVDGLGELEHWVLGYGPHAEVLAPPELRDRVRQLAADTAAQYGPAAAGGSAPRQAARVR